MLDASEQPDGVVAIANGFGSTYNFQHLLTAAHFRFNNESKTHRKEASSAELTAVKKINANAVAHVEEAAKARHQKRLRGEEQTFQQISAGIERTLDAYMKQKRAACYVGMDFQPIYKRSDKPQKAISGEEYSQWLADNRDFIASLPMHLEEWTDEIDKECQRRGVDVRVHRLHGLELICVEYPSV